MATLDVLAASNWSSVSAGQANIEVHNPPVGWTGSSWYSEGQVTFSTCQVSSGKRIESVQFAYSAILNPNGWSGGGPLNPWLLVKTGPSSTLLSSSIDNLTTVDLPSYDETQANITEIRMSAVRSWSPWMYAPGDGGVSDYFLTVSSLILTYTDNAPPYLWQDYVRSFETIDP